MCPKIYWLGRLALVLVCMNAFAGVKFDAIPLPTKGSELEGFKRALDGLPAEDRSLAESAMRIDPRIVGGRSIDIASAPWQVALVRGYISEQRSQFCGGSLIARDTVLTAAHCIDNSIIKKESSRVNVVAGTSTYISGGERISVSSLYIHPKWDPTTMDYDVAILKLSADSSLGEPISISTEPLSPPAQLFVSGWGAISQGGSGSIDLLGVELPMVPTARCNLAESYGGAITERMFCAGVREGGRDSCQGDSGGPIVTVANPPSLPTQVGVVSWGEGCARRLKYGVYSRLSAMSDWILGFTSN